MSALSCIICTIVILIIMFASIGIPIIVYYAQNPKDPTFTLEHASVHGFNLTSDGHFTSYFDIVIKANNPNHKMKLDYSGVRVSIYKDKQNLAEDALDDFAQRKRNVTVLRAEPIALSVSLEKGPLFNLGLESGIGYIIFDVFMTSGLNGDNLEVNCDYVMVNVTNLVASSPSSSSVDNSKENFSSINCGVYIYSDDDY
ncbi:hypothetical protein RND81_09G101700 [Saponaria officinalis]|uniref:Late embryogenesis abundant protein LEA-2 subgroup domain-containing protein n=1 Tax=Saponaria officinalis TaxID=3572 RepID=A0AAW1IK92_SAPOF